ncbi:PEP-CTERM sorting domain-containing protein [Chamaesiphon sp. VAR_48_metabat_135_sub]|uniref:PEP-CTERM sorting domain-containing protein n=1 Tax=Chamaesiphon sp. VAR_48_metabat_135_sub TaxID=2964699 RepID=UPI00286C6588|nr:PEP-CTERM sorting domain-containing protein [Chamaesiphon sp. VAR_48_metabat_135_sub]
MLAATNSAQAATVQFTDLASFQANTTGLTNIDFEGIAPAGGSVTTNLQNISGVGIANYDVYGNGTYSSLVVDSAYASQYNWGSGAVLSINPLRGLLVDLRNLPTGVNAVGIDFMSLAPAITGFDRFTFDFGLSNYISGSASSFETITVDIPLNYQYLTHSRQFIGITSTQNILYFFVRPTSGYLRLFDNVTFGTASAAATSVPEPFTVIGTLVGGTTALRMRKKLKSVGK